jgi:hypothetical protein
MSYERTLRKILQNTDLELSGRLVRIEEVASPLLSYTHGKFPYYTPHDFSHSLAVEENLNWLLLDDVKDKMNSYEIFFLVVAAWMHDWGMVGKAGEDPEQIRRDHHLRTEKNFEELYDKLFLSEHEARIIGRICRGHTKEDLYSKDFDDVVFGHNVRVRRRFLAAILRIADECDITYNRTPEIIYYNINPSDKAEEEFKKHLDVSGVGQLDEKHKIYISGIARDPKGAKTLREVREKIQRELDSVKGILAQNGLFLDVIDLRLESRGFIDKPIGFDVDKKRIVDLLIGEHLYKRRDVAIRELVQNSIDSCNFRRQTEPSMTYKIILRKPSKSSLEIEDNGMGMDYSTAKRFLSVVGASYYNTEEFRQLLKGKEFESIASFGIGILSSFLISEGIIVETMREGEDACRFTIGSLEEEWRYEKGSLNSPGTRITLILNKEGEAINLRESLEKYFAAPEIEISYQGDDGTLKKFESAWSIERVTERFYQEDEKVTPTELLHFETSAYNVILGTADNPRGEQLVLFNHGGLVGNFHISGLDYRWIVCVNAKKDLFDIHISRENVTQNERWAKFVSDVFNSVFGLVKDRLLDKDPRGYLTLMSELVESRLSISKEEAADLSRKLPFLKSFLEHALFPILSGDNMEFQKLEELLNSGEINVYSVYSRTPMDEIESILKFLDKDKMTLVNPYDLPKIGALIGEEGQETLICNLLQKAGKVVHDNDLASIILKNCSPTDEEFKDIMPGNVRLAHFPDGWKPLVVFHKKPAVLQTRHSLGSAYWGNILLWRRLVGDEKAQMLVESGITAHRYYLRDIELVSEPEVYIDAKDDFIERIFSMRKKGAFAEKISGMVFRYLKYLSYLPLVIQNLESCLIFLEVADNLEREIADSLGLDLPAPLLKRMGPSGRFYLEYLDRHGVGYEVTEKP